MFVSLVILQESVKFRTMPAMWHPKIYIFLIAVGLLSFREIASIESGMGFLTLKMRHVDSNVLNISF